MAELNRTHGYIPKIIFYTKIVAHYASLKIARHLRRKKKRKGEARKERTIGEREEKRSRRSSGEWTLKSIFSICNPDTAF